MEVLVRPGQFCGITLIFPLFLSYELPDPQNQLSVMLAAAFKTSKTHNPSAMPHFLLPLDFSSVHEKKNKENRRKVKSGESKMTLYPHTLPTILDSVDISAQMLHVQIKLPTHISHLL